MNIEKWNSLSDTEKDTLAAKFGLSRGGLGNALSSEKELEKVIEPKVEELTTKKDAKKTTTKKVAKLAGKKLAGKPKAGRRLAK